MIERINPDGSRTFISVDELIEVLKLRKEGRRDLASRLEVLGRIRVTSGTRASVDDWSNPLHGEFLIGHEMLEEIASEAQLRFGESV